MSETAADAPRAQTTIIIPGSQPMVALLGTQDEYLRLVEQAFPASDIMARGNEITVSGSPEDVAIVDTLIAEMLAVFRSIDEAVGHAEILDTSPVWRVGQDNGALPAAK